MSPPRWRTPPPKRQNDAGGLKESPDSHKKLLRPLSPEEERIFTRLYDARMPHHRSRDCCKKAFETRAELLSQQKKRVDQLNETRVLYRSKRRNKASASFFDRSDVSPPPRQTNPSARDRFTDRSSRNRSEFRVFNSESLDVSIVVQVNRNALRNTPGMSLEHIEELKLAIDLQNLDAPSSSFNFSENRGETREIILKAVPESQQTRSTASRSPFSSNRRPSNPSKSPITIKAISRKPKDRRPSAAKESPERRKPSVVSVPHSTLPVQEKPTLNLEELPPPPAPAPPEPQEEQPILHPIQEKQSAAMEPDDDINDTVDVTNSQQQQEPHEAAPLEEETNEEINQSNPANEEETTKEKEEVNESQPVQPPFSTLPQQSETNESNAATLNLGALPPPKPAPSDEEKSSPVETKSGQASPPKPDIINKGLIYRMARQTVSSMIIEASSKLLSYAKAVRVIQRAWKRWKKRRAKLELAPPPAVIHEEAEEEDVI
eukprot:TRINITY_DN1995_c0_g1_i1.p1 TRINITY_DN1995_c0_g1~~TRINITY_DN1995_c0_g1_i1.p1  ORF type:complete len:490 (-),score=131.38 TRINITY_DN1995_c0_g1_i1:123-1592(-)